MNSKRLCVYYFVGLINWLCLSVSLILVYSNYLVANDVTGKQGKFTMPGIQSITSRYPCPCGNHGDTYNPCTCSNQVITRYQKRISGPLLDRIDIHIEVPRVEYEKLSDDRLGEKSAVVQARVEAARQIQLERFARSDLLCNACFIR